MQPPPITIVRRSRLHGGLRELLDLPVILAACFALAVLLRAVGLQRGSTTDEGYWMQRTLRFGAALARGDLGSTYRSGHPGVSVMWVGLAGVGPSRLAPFIPPRYIDYETLETAPGYLDALGAARGAITVATAALFALIVGLTWRLLGPGPGLAGGALLLLDPYLVGMSRLLHPDALLAPLMAVSVLSGLIAWRGGRWPYLVLSAVAGGLALLTKAPAIFLPGFFGLVGLAVARPWRSPRQWLVTVLCWGIVAAAVYLALWPALWVDPVGRIGQVVGFVLRNGGAPHPESSFFWGSPVPDPGPLFYPVALAYRLSPVTLLGVAAVSLAISARSARSGPVLWLLLYAALFVAMMTLGAKKFDRYALPAMVVLDILGGVGLWSLVRGCSRVGWPVAAVAAAATLLLVQGTLLWRAYPHPIAFYNPLLGGAAGAQHALMVGWGEGLEQVTRYLNSLPQSDRLVLAANYNHVVRPRFRGMTVPLVAYERAAARGQTPPAYPDYVLVYINAAQRRQVPWIAQQAIAAGSPEFTAFVHGTEYAWVYRVPPGLRPPLGDTVPMRPADLDEESDDE